MQAIEDGDVLLHHGQAARQSVSSILGELEALRQHVAETLNDEKQSDG